MSLKRIFFSVLLLVSLSLSAAPAGSSDNPVAYLKKVGEGMERISDDLWNYVRMMAHSNDARVVEQKRIDLIRSVQSSIRKTSELPPFKGDAEYRDAALDFLKTMDIMLRQDYAKLVDMEEVSEESYDAMEAYLLAKKKANEKFAEASDRFSKAEKDFFAHNNIRMIENESPVTKKLRKAGKVTEYFDHVYLIFFKSDKQELYLLRALEKKDMSEVEQNRIALEKSSLEGLKKMEKVDPFESDSSLIVASRDYLQFTLDESRKSVPLLTEFDMKRENFDKLKKAFDLKSPQERTQDDVDLYNSKVKELNELAKRNNQLVAELNERRGMLIRRWNNAARLFYDTHVPE